MYAASTGVGEMKAAAARATGSRARRARYTKHTASPRVVMITYIGSQNYTTHGPNRSPCTATLTRQIYSLDRRRAKRGEKRE